MPGTPLSAQQSWGVTSDPARAATASVPAPVASDLSTLRVLVDQGMEFLRADNTDDAFWAFNAARDLAAGSPDLAQADALLPDLALARLAQMQQDYDAMSAHAARAATLPDTSGAAARAMQAEALAWQGIAAFGQDHLNEADLLMRAALSATADRPALAEIHDTVRVYMALLAYRLNAPDATELREDVLYSGFQRPFYVSLEEMAYLFYVDAYAARAAGAAPEDLLSYVAEMIEAFTEDAGVSEDTRSTLNGFYGMLLGEAGRNGDALSHLQQHHDHLLEIDALNDDFVWNVQRLAMTRSNLGDTAGAYAFLDDMLVMLRAKGVDSGIFAVLEQDMGGFLDTLKRPSEAQVHYRRAYEILRATRGITDNDVTLLRPLIDVADPSFMSFAFADEIAAQGKPLTLTADGTDVLRRFLSGDYQSVVSGLSHARQDETTDPVIYETNRALFFALAGEFSGAQEALAQARATADPDAALFLDLIDALSRVWGSDHAPESASALLERLMARLDDLPADQALMVVALVAEQGFRMNNTEQTARMADAWQVRRHMEAPPTPWRTLADVIGFEAASMGLTGDALADLVAEVDADITGDASVARDYLWLIHLANGGVTITGEYMVAELGVVVRRFRNSLPPQHFLNAAAEYAMSEAFQWRNETDQALIWLERATDTTRANPWHSPTVLAFLLAKQATLLGVQGAVERAALMGREAYDVADFTAPRTDLLAGVVRSHAESEFGLTGDAQEAAAIYARHLDDPLYFNGLGAILRVTQLQQMAGYMLNYAPWEDTRAVLDRAAAEVPEDGDDAWATWQSGLEWTRAIGAQFDGDPVEGWAAMVRSDRFEVAFRDALRARDSADGLGPDEAVLRAQWTAQIGWDYAQTLEK